MILTWHPNIPDRHRFGQVHPKALETRAARQRLPHWREGLTSAAEELKIRRMPEYPWQCLNFLGTGHERRKFVARFTRTSKPLPE